MMNDTLIYICVCCWWRSVHREHAKFHLFCLGVLHSITLAKSSLTLPGVEVIVSMPLGLCRRRDESTNSNYNYSVLLCSAVVIRLRYSVFYLKDHYNWDAIHDNRVDLS
jgi:hypothetical protein